MQVVKIDEKSAWNSFVAANSSPSSFLQSWEWGEFQKALGHKVYRLAISDLARAQVIVRELRFGKLYMEVPKGPIFSSRGLVNAEVWQVLRDKFLEIGQKEKAVLVRINPPYTVPSDQFASLNFRRPEMLLHQREPEQTILVDLLKSEDELLLNMHEKSRYNIRLAERKGVAVRDATKDRSAFVRFLEILDETAKRDHIVLWSPERFWKFREVFMTGETTTEPRAIFLVGEYRGQILAGAVVMLYGDSGTYLYAGSSARERSANAPSVVLWEAIRLAKRQNKKWYDMWGITPRGAPPDHPWAGISRFKSRYVNLAKTGKEIYQPGTRDLVFRPLPYQVLRWAKKLRG